MTPRARGLRVLARKGNRRSQGPTAQRPARPGWARFLRRGRPPAPSRRRRRCCRRRERAPRRAPGPSLHRGSRPAPSRRRDRRDSWGPPTPSGRPGLRVPGAQRKQGPPEVQGKPPGTRKPQDPQTPCADRETSWSPARRAPVRRGVRRDRCAERDPWAHRHRRTRSPRRRDLHPSRPRGAARQSGSHRPRWWRRAGAPGRGQRALHRRTEPVRLPHPAQPVPARPSRRIPVAGQDRSAPPRALRHRRIPAIHRDRRHGRERSHQENRGGRQVPGGHRQVRPVPQDHLRGHRARRRRRRWHVPRGAGRGPGEGPRRRWGRGRRCRRRPRGRAR